MNERQIAIIRSMAGSHLWENFRDEIVREYILKVRDVTETFGEPTILELIKLNPAAVYVGKLIAATALEDLIKMVDNSEEKYIKKEDYN